MEITEESFLLASNITPITLPSDVNSRSVVILMDGDTSEVPHVASNDLFPGKDGQILYLTFAPLSEPVDVVLLENSGESSVKTRKGLCRTEQVVGDELKFEERLQVLDALLSSCNEMENSENDSHPIKTELRRKDGNYVCDLCGAIFKQELQYYGHLHSHKGERVWRCEKCPGNKQVFSTESLLRRHEKSHHLSLRPFKCDVCEATYERSSQLEYHWQSVHALQRRFPCKFCSKAFYKRSDLRSHLAIHLSLQCSVCEVCGRAFSHISNLIRHSHLHTGTKPYPCSVCGRRFVQLTSLKQHKISHENLSLPCPAVPNECSKRFRSPLLARKHALTMHAGVQWEDPPVRSKGTRQKRHFYCTVCGDKFDFATDMRDHQIKLHAVNCTDCGQVFSSTGDLNTHKCIRPSIILEESHNAITQNNEEKDCLVRFNVEEGIGTKAIITVENQYINSVCSAGNDDGELYFNTEGLLPTEGTEGNNVLELGEQTDLSSEHTDLSAQIESLLQDTPGSVNDSEIVIYVSQGDDTPHQVRVTTLQNPFSTNGMSPQVADTQLGNTHQQKHSHQVKKLENVSEKTQGFSDTLGLAVTDATPPQNESSKNLVEVNPDTTDSSPPILPSETTVISACNTSLLHQQQDVESSATASESAVQTPSNASKSQKCPECGKIFDKASNLKQHLGTHFSELRNYECKHCGQNFAWKSSMNKHILTQHRDVPPQFTCNTCGKHYPTAGQAHDHVRRDHLGQRPHACHICSKTFFRKYDLHTHIRVHTKEKPYMCGTCGKTFNHVSHMKRHELIHQGVKQHQCSICGCLFSQSSSLNIHRQRHFSNS